MSRVCQRCGKSYQKGNQVTVAWGVKYRSIKRFQPNLRRVTLAKGQGASRRLLVCTSCLKSLKNKNQLLKPSAVSKPAPSV